MRKDEMAEWQTKVSAARSGQSSEQTVRPQGEQDREGLKETSLEQAPDVAQQFDGVSRGEVIEQTKQEPANENKREGLEGTSLANAPDMGSQFDRAHDGQGIEQEQTADVQSEQVRGSGQRNEMKPPAETAETVDRERHQNEMGKDQQRVDEARRAAVEERLKALQEMNAGKGEEVEQDQEKDRGYEMG